MPLQLINRAQRLRRAKPSVNRQVEGFFDPKNLPIIEKNGQIPAMAAPDSPVTLTPEQIDALNTLLADTRHDVNNNLSLIIAAVELIKRKPDSVERMITTIAQQPDNIMKQLRGFSDEFEKVLNITKD